MNRRNAATPTPTSTEPPFLPVLRVSSALTAIIAAVIPAPMTTTPNCA